MGKIQNLIRKIAWPGALVATAGSALLFLLVSTGGFDGGFLPVVTQLIYLLLGLGILGVMTALIVLRKKELLARLAIPFMTGMSVFLFLQYSAFIPLFGSVDDGLFVSTAVFLLLELLAFLTALALYCIGSFGKKEKLLPIARLVGLGACCFGLVPLILLLVSYGRAQANWTNYVNAFALCLFYPASALFTLLFVFGKEEEKTEEPVEEPEVIEEKAEPVEEEPAPEAKPKEPEAPVEEKPDEKPEEKPEE